MRKPKSTLALAKPKAAVPLHSCRFPPGRPPDVDDFLHSAYENQFMDPCRLLEAAGGRRAGGGPQVWPAKPDRGNKNIELGRH